VDATLSKPVAVPHERRSLRRLDEPTAPLRVETAEGPLRGKTADGVRAFLGIPFAAPPIGDLRWRHPPR